MDNIERYIFCKMLLNNPCIFKQTMSIVFAIQQRKQEIEANRTLDDMAFGC